MKISELTIREKNIIMKMIIIIVMCMIVTTLISTYLGYIFYIGHTRNTVNDYCNKYKDLEIVLFCEKPFYNNAIQFTIKNKSGNIFMVSDYLKKYNISIQALNNSKLSSSLS